MTFFQEFDAIPYVFLIVGSWFMTNTVAFWPFLQYSLFMESSLFPSFPVEDGTIFLVMFCLVFLEVIFARSFDVSCGMIGNYVHWWMREHDAPCWREDWSSVDRGRSFV